MTSLREDQIHLAVRRFLKERSWQLVAGQYPNGSDDELHALNIVDPLLACDHSPDHRRHSKNKFVPDLVACKGNKMLIIEMKPTYSRRDEEKLMKLLSERRPHLLSALKDLVETRGVKIQSEISDLVFLPALGFSGPAPNQRNQGLCYFSVQSQSSVAFQGNETLPSI
jgi:hypothetical protein